MQIQSRRESNNDHAFEALLQSQRELLSQMKYGTPLKWGSTPNTANTSQTAECGFEKLVFNRRSSLDKLFPSVLKRKSLGGTSHYDTYELPSLDKLDLNMKSDCRGYPRKHQTDGLAVVGSKKRKIAVPCLSSTGLLEEEEDNLPILSKPDFSESSERSFELDFELLDFNDGSSLIEEQEESMEDGDGDKLEKQTESTLVTEAETDDDEGDEIDHVQQENVKYEPKQVQKIVQAFRAAMERSQYTQQSIHDWDKKMGLKRSHSKTMRLSARSRKKLRAIFKREFAVDMLA